MAIAGTLVRLYAAQGVDIVTGLSPQRFGGMISAGFTWFMRDGRSLTNGLGIALQEIYLLEHLCAHYQPRRVLVIGNALGWSSVALALLLRGSRVVAIDAGFDENSLYGLELTNRIASAAGLDLVALKHVSPAEVGTVIDAELGGTVDFAFIDGLHTNEQIVLDYQAVAAKAAGDAVYLFHDIEACGLQRGLAEIERIGGRPARRLSATPSGMALLFEAARHAEITDAIAAFAPAPALLAPLEEAAWRHQHRHIARWQRSLEKRWRRIRRTTRAPA